MFFELVGCVENLYSFNGLRCKSQPMWMLKMCKTLIFKGFNSSLCVWRESCIVFAERRF